MEKIAVGNHVPKDTIDLDFSVEKNIKNYSNATRKNPNEITEDRQTRRRQNYNTSKEEVLNSDELATRNRNIGANASSGNSVTQTIVREQKKIGRNERVMIRNIQTGELKELKYKQAEPLINTGKWIINDN